MYRVIPAALFGAAFVLGACSSGPSPFQREVARPGADRSVPASNQLPPAPTRGGYDGAAAPEDDSRGARVGALVAHEGGQQVQKKEEEKERAEAEAARNKRRLEEQQQRAPSSAQMPAATEAKTQ